MSTFLSDQNGELSPISETVLSGQASQLPGDLGATFAKMFITLTSLVILLLITYWFLKKLIQTRLQKGLANSSIQILEKRMISPKTTLYLIEIEGKKIALAESHLEVKAVLNLDVYPQI